MASTTVPRVSRFASIVAEAEKKIEAEARGDDGEDVTIFSATEQEVIKTLKTLTIGTRIACFYYAKHKVDFPLIHRSFPDLLMEEWAAIAQTYVTLGTSALPPGKLGEIEPDKYQEHRSLPVHIIKASIVGPRMAAVDSYTDMTVIDLVTSLPGTVAKEGGKGEAVLIPGGYNKPVVFSTVAPYVGRALSGVEEFMIWRQEVHGKKNEYRVVPHEIRVVARYFATRYSFSVKDEALQVEARPVPTTRKIGITPPSPPLLLSKYEEAILAMARSAYSDRTVRPSGMGASSNPIEFLGWLLSAEWVSLAAEDRAVVLQYARGINQYVDKVIAHVSPIAEKITNKALAMYEPLGIPLQAPYTAGAIADYVQAHRGTIRTIPTIDVPRKSDAGPIARVAGSATSVPDKIARAFNLTKLPRKKYAVHAFGTHTNWMWKEVKDIAKTVVWFDIDAKNEVKGEEFYRKDIFKLGQDEGLEKILIDDTMVDDPPSKLVAIHRAGYEAFISKMYYGRGSEKNMEVGRQLAPSIEMILSHYTLWWSQGGGVHSPEYFLVGVKKNSPLHAPHIARTVDNVFDDLLDAQVIHGVGLLRQNILRSAQVLAGGLCEDPKWAVNGPPGPSLLLGGKGDLRAPTVEVPSTPVPAQYTRISRYGRGDPEVASQLNGTHGEETNSDDVPHAHGRFPPWIPEATLEAIKAFLLSDPVADVWAYPDPILPGMSWVMPPPNYGESRGIALGGATYRAGVMCRRGSSAGNPVYVFTVPSTPLRFCMCVVPTGYCGYVEWRIQAILNAHQLCKGEIPPYDIIKHIAAL